MQLRRRNLRVFVGLMNLLSISLFTYRFGYSDELQLKNGDRISGEIQSMDESKLVIKTPYADKLELAWEAVASATSEQPIFLQLDNGEVYHLPLKTPQPGLIDLGTPIFGTKTVEFAAIRKISREAIGEDQPPKPKWEGSVTAMAEARTGNREAYSYFLKAEAKRTTETQQLTLRTDGGYGQSDGFVDTTVVRGQANIRQFLTPKTYLFGDLLLEHDRFEEVDLRSDSTAGAGYRWIDTERSQLLTDLGAGITAEWDGFGAETTDPTLRLGLDYTQKLFERSKLSQTLTTYPSLGDWGDFRLISQTSFETPIYDSLSWTLNLTDEYDNAPSGPEVEKNDLSVRTGLQYNF